MFTGNVDFNVDVNPAVNWPLVVDAVWHEVMITHIQLGANCSRDVTVINKVNPLCPSSCLERAEGPVSRLHPTTQQLWCWGLNLDMLSL